MADKHVQELEFLRELAEHASATSSSDLNAAWKLLQLVADIDTRYDIVAYCAATNMRHNHAAQYIGKKSLDWIKKDLIDQIEQEKMKMLPTTPQRKVTKPNWEQTIIAEDLQRPPSDPVQGDCVDVISGKYKGNKGLVDHVFNGKASVYFIRGGNALIDMDDLALADNCED